MLGLQTTHWADARRQRGDERDYLQRLLADSDANLAELKRAMGADRRAAAQILSISQGLEDPAGAPDPGALSNRLCRWFVHPEIHLQSATYAELVSSGRLLLIRDQPLRAQLASEDAAHVEAKRLDVLIPAVQRAAEPIEALRTWYIDTTPTSKEIRFDIRACAAIRAWRQRWHSSIGSVNYAHVPPARDYRRRTSARCYSKRLGMRSRPASAARTGRRFAG